MTLRLLRQLWADTCLHWRVFWHIVRCAETCGVRGSYLWTGGSYECADAQLQRYGCVRHRRGRLC